MEERNDVEGSSERQIADRQTQSDRERHRGERAMEIGTEARRREGARVCRARVTDEAKK